MRLSDAIKFGRTLRLESHQQGEPFVRVANTDELRSDVWGAAVEAVHSLIAKRSWTAETRQSDMAYFCDIQRQHFGEYFKTPAVCPGAAPRNYMTEGVRIVNRHGHYVREGEKQKRLGPITSDCHLILNLAEFVEHAFYAHNWTSEEVAQAVELSEKGRELVVAQTFEHHQDEALRRTIAQRVVAEARQREVRRYQLRTGNRTYIH